MADDEFEVGRFAFAFQRFLERIHELAPTQSSAWRERAIAHLGVEPDGLPALAEKVASSDLPNLQLALDALTAASHQWELVGLPSEARHYGGFSLPTLLSGRMGAHLAPTAAAYVNVDIAVDETLACVELGVYFLDFDGVPVIVLVAAGMEHGPRPGLAFEVMSPDREASARFLARVRALMHERNVYRGKVLAFAFSEYGGFGVTFHRVPALARDQLILPEADLAAIEQHTIAVSSRADELRAAGRHLKRGLLLYGPPGTGKTLSVMYLCNEMPGRTTLLLTGMGAGALGQAVAIARSLQPSMVVLEDVDLVAMERTIPALGANPLLFQLLNEMDGLDEDADVIFVLTTNRVELLEPALAARPGRIDQAVEIKLPDADCRRRLFELYLRGVRHEVGDGDGLAHLVERTDGVSAAFVRELVRRAVLTSMDIGEDILTVDRLAASLTDLLEHSTPILRSTLGANPDVASGAPPMPPPGPHTGGVMYRWTGDS